MTSPTYRIVPCCRYRSYFIVGVMPKEGFDELVPAKAFFLYMTMTKILRPVWAWPGRNVSLQYLCRVLIRCVHSCKKLFNPITAPWSNEQTYRSSDIWLSPCSIHNKYILRALHPGVQYPDICVLQACIHGGDSGNEQHFLEF